MNRIFFYLTILLGFQLITSCEFFEGSSHIDPDDPNIEYIGRFDFSNPKSVRFDWPGVQIRTKFEGTSCSIKLRDGNNDYNVFIDGRLHKMIRTTSDTIYVIANGLQNKVHTLLITKRTEALFGVAAFEGFILDGGKDLVKSIKILKEKEVLNSSATHILQGSAAKVIPPIVISAAKQKTAIYLLVLSLQES